VRETFVTANTAALLGIVTVKAFMPRLPPRANGILKRFVFRQGLDRARKVDVRLPGKGNSNYHGARPVY